MYEITIQRLVPGSQVRTHIVADKASAAIEIANIINIIDRLDPSLSITFPNGTDPELDEIVVELRNQSGKLLSTLTARPKK